MVNSTSVWQVKCAQQAAKDNSSADGLQINSNTSHMLATDPPLANQLTHTPRYLTELTCWEHLHIVVYLLQQTKMPHHTIHNILKAILYTQRTMRCTTCITYALLTLQQTHGCHAWKLHFCAMASYIGKLYSATANYYGASQCRIYAKPVPIGPVVLKYTQAKEGLPGRRI